MEYIYKMKNCLDQKSNFLQYETYNMYNNPQSIVNNKNENEIDKDETLKRKYSTKFQCKIYTYLSY